MRRRMRAAAVLWGGLVAASCAGARQPPHAPAGAPVQLHHVTLGEGDPIILLHGFGGSLYTWRYVQDELAASHRVILFDLKGHGRSPKPKDDEYAVLDQAALLRRFILEHDLRNLTLVGNSYGGGVALTLALQLEREDPGRIERLVLIDAAAYRQRLPFHMALLRLPLVGPLSLALLSSRCAVEMVLEKTFHDDDQIPRDAVAEYARALDEPGGRFALIQAARQVVPANIDDLTRSYPGFAVPTLIVWGRDDELIPTRLGRRLQKDLPDARLRIIPACGHAPQEECPEALLPLIEAFLRSSGAGALHHGSGSPSRS